jgi:hypothetical protein
VERPNSTSVRGRGPARNHSIQRRWGGHATGGWDGDSSRVVFWAGFRVTAGPDARINGIPFRRGCQRGASDEFSERREGHRSLIECIVHAAPPSLKGRCQAQVSGGLDHGSNEDGIHEIEQGIAPTAAAAVHVGAEGA